MSCTYDSSDHGSLAVARYDWDRVRTVDWENNLAPALSAWSMLRPETESNDAGKELAEKIKDRYGIIVDDNNNIKTSFQSHAVLSLGMGFGFLLERQTPVNQASANPETEFGLKELSNQRYFERLFPGSDVVKWDKNTQTPYWFFKMIRNAFAHAQWWIQTNDPNCTKIQLKNKRNGIVT